MQWCAVLHALRLPAAGASSQRVYGAALGLFENP
jgi:AhpD family alkylhydroperoxidase